MDLKLVPFFHLFILTLANVHEEVDEVNRNQRVKRLDVIQINQQKLRYLQQQRANTKPPKKREAYQYVDQTDIQALTSLIGKAPLAQLEGLKNLINPQDHKPIHEHVLDVANPRSKPNVVVEPAPPELQKAVADSRVLQGNEKKLFLDLAQIEKELNDQAMARAQEAIAKAQKHALAQVAAQEQAVALAQVQAQKALQPGYGHTLANPLKPEVQPEKVLVEPLYGHAPSLVDYNSLKQDIKVGQVEKALVNPLYGHVVDHHPLQQDVKVAYIAESAEGEDQPVHYRQPFYEPGIPIKGIYGTHKDLQYAAQYAFGYRVRDHKSGNDFGHEEIHDGKVARGAYHVLLPDGRLQKVQYWADASGFHAKVSYDGVARH